MLISTAHNRWELLAASQNVTKSIPTYPITFFSYNLAQIASAAPRIAACGTDFCGNEQPQ